MELPVAAQGPVVQEIPVPSRAGGGGGQGGKWSNAAAAGGGGGGGRAATGSAGSPGNSGSAANPTSVNCASVSPGSPYSVVVPSGGQIVVSWCPQ